MSGKSKDLPLFVGQMIDSPANSTVKALRSLSTSKGRREQGRFLVEGIRLVEDGLSAGTLPEICLYNYDLVGRTDRGRTLVKALLAAEVNMQEATERAIEAVSDTQHPQGIIAAFRLPSWDPPAQSARPALALICDAVQDPGNLGTLLRSAEAAGVAAAWLAPGCVDAYSPKVVRAAMGAHFRLPLYTRSWSEISADLQLLGVAATTLYATTAGAETPYDQVDWTLSSGLIISNEAHGLSAEAREAISNATYISIPMHGQTESLNAAVAGSIILFEAARQRRASAQVRATGGAT